MNDRPVPPPPPTEHNPPGAQTIYKGGQPWSMQHRIERLTLTELRHLRWCCLQGSPLYDKLGRIIEAMEA